MFTTFMLVLWLVSFCFSFGAVNADSRAFMLEMRRVFPLAYSTDYDYRKEEREWFWLNVLVSLMPVGNLVTAIFSTGFLQHGWTFNVKTLPRHHK